MSANTLEIILTDSQLDQLAERICSRLAKAQTHNKPLTTTEAAKTLGEFMIECSNLVDCAAWPVTDWHPEIESASHAWNSGNTF